MREEVGGGVFGSAPCVAFQDAGGVPVSVLVGGAGRASFLVATCRGSHCRWTGDKGGYEGGARHLRCSAGSRGQGTAGGWLVDTNGQLEEKRRGEGRGIWRRSW